MNIGFGPRGHLRFDARNKNGTYWGQYPQCVPFLFARKKGTRMALTSASTYSDAIAQYKDNLSWEGDLTKARAFREAIRFLMLERPTRTSHGDGSGLDRESLQGQLNAVDAYLKAVDTTARPRASFVQGRARHVL